MSTIAAGTTSGTALVSTGDTSGQLVLQTNGTTTAVTIGTNQVVSLAQPLPVASGGTGATSLTANNVILGNGGSAVQVVAPSTNGNVLTSNGTTWTSAAPAGGGSWVYLNSFTPSGNTIYNITGQFSSTYDDYVFICEGIQPSAGSENLNFRLYINGTIQTSGYWSVRASVYNNNTSFGSGGGSGSVSLLADTTGVTATTQSIAGQIFLFNVNSSSQNMASYDFAYTSLENPGGNYGMWLRGSARNANSGPITGIRMYWDAATFTSAGVIRLYGIKKS
tara:strand:- start:143 stop:976 length:834 start_codon:yes stop_codon:yes gene_type:complete